MARLHPAMYIASAMFFMFVAKTWANDDLGMSGLSTERSNPPALSPAPSGRWDWFKRDGRSSSDDSHEKSTEPSFFWRSWWGCDPWRICDGLGRGSLVLHPGYKKEQRD